MNLDGLDPGDKRVVSNDAFAILAWYDEPRAVGGGYWWPERLPLPTCVLCENGLRLPFLPYAPVGAKQVSMMGWGQNRPSQLGADVVYVPSGSPEVAAAARRRVVNRPLVCGPGELVHARLRLEKPDWMASTGLECYLKAPPLGLVKATPGATWAWTRSFRATGSTMAIWLPADREEEFLAETAAVRLKRSKDRR